MTMKRKRLAIAAVLPLILLFSSCGYDQVGNLSGYFSSAPQSAQAGTARGASIRDQLSAPDRMLYCQKDKTVVISKGRKFDGILKAANLRLRGMKISVSAVSADFEFADQIAGLRYLEFAYKKPANLAFRYYGPAKLPAGWKGKIIDSFYFTKIFFPLEEPRNSGLSFRFSLSFFCNDTDPNDRVGRNGRSYRPICGYAQIGPVSALNTLLQEDFRQG
jgi:hypothetical protein